MMCYLITFFLFNYGERAEWRCISQTGMTARVSHVGKSAAQHLSNMLVNDRRCSDQVQ